MDHLDTRVVWAGEAESLAHGGTQVPVQHSIAFGYDDVDSWLDVALGNAPGHIYSRNTNPTVRAFERKIADLEGAEHAIAFASGMAAVSGTLFTLLTPGRRVVSVKDTYGGTNQLFIDLLPRQKVDVDLCDTEDHEAVERAISRGLDVLYLETPTNPTLKVVDIEPLTAAAHEKGAIVIVDNTFATPINQQPLALGADLVVHSASKFLGGHADALGGALAGRRDLVEAVYHYREITGAALSPHDAYMLLRGMKTLALRIERQNASARAHRRLARGARRRRGGLLPRPRVERRSRDRRAPDVGLRRHAGLLAGRRLRGRAHGAAEAAPGAPGGEPRRRRDDRGHPRHHQPRRVHRRGARRDGHPRGAGAPVRRHREP